MKKLVGLVRGAGWCKQRHLEAMARAHGGVGKGARNHWWGHMEALLARAPKGTSKGAWRH